MTHSLTHSLTWFDRLIAALAVVTTICLAASVRAQVPVYATHDWPNPPDDNMDDRWSDVKTPGDGRTYSVGSTTISMTSALQNQSRPYSGSVAGCDTSVATIAGGSRQVALLQVSGPGGIIWQRYFYGETLLPFPPQPGNGLSTHARAISVYPSATLEDTRIAICGETFDRNLPRSSSVNKIWSNTYATGWVAVYDGNGNLRWTLHLHGFDPMASTVVTDLSIRVDGTLDEVTYCGVTSNGFYTPTPPDPNLETTIEPIRPFDAQAMQTTCIESPASGSSHNASAPDSATNQWDGFVGRASAPHAGSPPITVTRDFFSIVGGSFQDGLFGLAELDRDNFVVVGSTTSSTASSGPARTVPLSRQVPFNWPVGLGLPEFCFHTTAGWGSFGTVFWFNSTLTRLPQDPQMTNNLLLLESTILGSHGRNTIARDAIWHGGLMWIVGSTDDPAFTSLDAYPARGTFDGPTDGFVVTCVSPNSGVMHASYSPFTPSSGTGADAVNGIASWNEFPDHVALGGWTNVAQGGRDFLIESWFHDTYTQPTRLRRIRSAIFGGTQDDQPTFYQALTAGLSVPSWLPTSYANLGEPGGGGIAVDDRGRVTAAGSTFSVFSSTNPSSGFPGSDPELLAVLDRPQQAGHNGQAADAVRAVFDMVPQGVCRTDLTGNCPPGWSRVAGDGGTTPACGRLPFGNQIGGPSSFVNRTMIDFEGDLIPNSTNCFVLLDRPAGSSMVQASVMKIGFPYASPIAYAGVPGIEVWLDASVSVSQLYVSTGTSIRVPLGSLPAGSGVFSIQFVSLLTLPTGSTPPCNDPAAVYVASPALIFGY